MIGPPTPGLMSYAFFISFGAGRRRLRSSSVRLLVCQPEFTPVANTVPRMVLPPSRGMISMRRPPKGCSAETAAWGDHFGAGAAEGRVGGSRRVVASAFRRRALIGNEIRELAGRQDIAK